MVQEVTIPLSRLNVILPAAPLEDVEFQVPELEDIEEAADDAFPGLDEIGDRVREEIDDALEGLDLGVPQLGDIDEVVTEELDEALGNFDEQVGQAIQEATEDLDVGLPAEIEVGIDGSLFSVNEDFIDLLAEALDQVDFLDIEDFPDLPTLQESIDDVLTEIDEEVAGGLEELEETVTGDLEDLREDLELFTEIDSLDDLIDQVGENIADRLIDEEDRQAIRDFQEGNL